MKSSVDAESLLRLLSSPVKEAILQAVEDHRIYNETDLQALAFSSMLATLSEGNFLTDPLIIANARFTRWTRAKDERMFPDMMIFYHNTPLFVAEFKDCLNRRVGRSELLADFQRCRNWVQQYDVTSAVFAIMTESGAFRELAEDFEEPRFQPIAASISDGMTNEQARRWKLRHREHLEFVNDRISQLGRAH